VSPEESIIKINYIFNKNERNDRISHNFISRGLNKNPVQDIRSGLRKQLTNSRNWDTLLWGS